MNNTPIYAVRPYSPAPMLDGLGDAATAAKVTNITSTGLTIAAKALAPFPPAAAAAKAAAVILGFVSRGQGKLAEWSKKRRELKETLPKIHASEKKISEVIAGFHRTKGVLASEMMKRGINPASAAYPATPKSVALSGYLHGYGLSGHPLQGFPLQGFGYAGLRGWGLEGPEGLDALEKVLEKMEGMAGLAGLEGLDGLGWGWFKKAFRSVARVITAPVRYLVVKPIAATAKYVSNFRKNIAYDFNKFGEQLRDVFTPGAQEKRRFEKDLREVEAIVKRKDGKEAYMNQLAASLNNTSRMIEKVDEQKAAVQQQAAQVAQQRAVQAVQVAKVAQVRADQAAQATSAKKSNNTMLYVVGGLAAIGATIALTSKKKTKPASLNGTKKRKKKK